MSSFDADSNKAVPTTSSLRALVDALFVTDAELEAFCLDYFPKIQRLFSDGMSRLRKTNLLLENSDHRELYQILRRSSSNRLALLEHLIVFAPTENSEPPQLARAADELSSAPTENHNPELTLPGFFISIVEGPDKGKSFSLRNTRILVGRQQNADIYITDRGASRSVCGMNWDSTRKCFTIIDFGTTNGTRVNGELVRGPRKLRNGDMIEVGQSTKMVFSYQPRGGS